MFSIATDTLRFWTVRGELSIIPFTSFRRCEEVSGKTKYYGTIHRAVKYKILASSFAPTNVLVSAVYSKLCLQTDYVHHIYNQLEIKLIRN